MSSKGRAKNNTRVAVKREVDETLAKLDMKPRLLNTTEIHQLLNVNGPALAIALDYLETTGIIDPHVYVARNQEHRARQKAAEKRRDANAAACRDRVFTKACDLAHIEPTRRQASKFLRGVGAAYAKRSLATMELARAA